MHPNSTFRNRPSSDALDFALGVGFGALMVPAAGLVGAHVPFVIDPLPAQPGQDHPRLLLHLVRSNPIARALKPDADALEAMLMVQGPHAYISPDWYGLDDQVPTWNYVAVHLHGRLHALQDQALLHGLDALSERFERALQAETGKAPWGLEKMSQKALDGLVKAIRPFALEVLDVQSTYKLNQNKPTNAIKGAVEGLQHSSVGSQIAQLRALMTAQVTLSPTSDKTD